MSRLTNFLTLFTSLSTLVCCALPALLVSLGLGVVMAGVASHVPGLIWMSENKTGVFILAAVMLLGNGFWMWLNKDAPCPVDLKLREACLYGRKVSQRIYILSVVVFLTGAFFAYLAPIIFA